MKTPLNKLVLAATILAVSSAAIQPKPAQAGETVVAGMVATMAIVGSVLIVAATAGAISGHNVLKLKPMIAEVAPDAMRFIATDGREKSKLLSDLLEETSQEIAARGEDPSRYSEKQLAESIVKLALQIN